MNDYLLYNNQLLLELLSKGDESAFTELYTRYWKKLFTIAYNRLKEVEAAEDIVHDVFVGIWVNREKLQIEFLENYLATATKYAVLSKIKKKAQERMYNNNAAIATVFELPVETALHYKQILDAIKKEVEKLPEKCRLIFKYSRNEGMPVKQIAKELHLSPKTVENQLHKAVKQLKLVTKSFLHFLLFLTFIFFSN
ncbi:RNA polymerase sigma factor [Ferruginibacter sp.]|nr:RNA polymerase sigma-70 factor [Ferruginibacter sp.]